MTGNSKGFLYRFLGSNFMQSVAFTSFEVFFLWKIVEIYHSVFLAGMLTTITLGVAITSSIPIGHVIDRANSTVLSLIASLFALSASVLLFFSTHLYPIYIADALFTLGSTMKGDSFSAIIKKHLSSEDFHSANSITTGSRYLSLLAGTFLGGLAISFFSRLLIPIIIILALISMFTAIPIEEERNVREEGGIKKEMASAMHFYRKILGFLIVGLVINGIFQSIDVYSSGLFHLVLNASSVYYTVFIAVISIGGIAGSILVNRVESLNDHPFFLAFLIILYAPFFIFLGISRSAAMDIFVAFIIGFLLPVINIPLTTKLMKAIPRNIFGKVNAFLRVFLNGSTPIVAALLSFVTLYFQVDVIFFYLGIIMIPVTLLSIVVIPRFFMLKEEIVSKDAKHVPQ